MESSQLPNSQLLAQPPVWQLVLRKPWTDISGFEGWLKENTLRYIVAEHPADEEIATTHCHILLEGLKVTDEGLRKQVKKYSPGQGQYAFMKVQKRTRQPYSQSGLAIYMSKGQSEYIKSHSLADESIQEYVLAWETEEEYIERETGEPKKDKDYTLWNITLKVRELAKKTTTIKTCRGEYGEYDMKTEQSVEATLENFQLLCEEMNKHKIRSSRNELERAWVTLLRQDQPNQQALFESINKNVFR